MLCHLACLVGVQVSVDMLLQGSDALEQAMARRDGLEQP